MPEVLTQRSDGPPLPALAHTPPARTESTGKAMITSTQIARRVHEMGREISRVYTGIDSPVVLVVILKGATVFAADLLRSLSVPAELEFIRAASYGSGTTRGPLRLAHMMDGPLVDRHVLLVEDIVDSGHTVEAITRRVKRMKPASLRLAALLDRPARRAVRVEIDFKGFVIPDRFVIGYGLDYAGLYRELPGIYSLG
jgi:hypoxanthine phosphoribosyltransferase